MAALPPSVIQEAKTIASKVSQQLQVLFKDKILTFWRNVFGALNSCLFYLFTVHFSCCLCSSSHLVRNSKTHCNLRESNIRPCDRLMLFPAASRGRIVQIFLCWINNWFMSKILKWFILPGQTSQWSRNSEAESCVPPGHASYADSQKLQTGPRQSPHVSEVPEEAVWGWAAGCRASSVHWHGGGVTDSAFECGGAVIHWGKRKKELCLMFVYGTVLY